MSASSGPIVVIGAKGAVGREICLQAQAANLPVVGWGRDELSATVDFQALLALFDAAKPRAVINCLSMTGLDKCFREAPQAFEANGFFPLKLAAVAKIRDLPMVQFSTENVFPCNINGLIYSEDDRTEPNTVYGLTKLLGEAADLRPFAPFHVVRLPMLFGPTNDRQIVAKLVNQLILGNEITVSTDVYTTPLYTPDAAGFIVEWLKGGRTLAPVTHLTTEHRIALFDLMQIIAAVVGVKGRIQATVSAKFPSLEVKPLHAGLRSNVTAPFSFEGAINRYADWIKRNEKVIRDEPQRSIA